MWVCHLVRSALHGVLYFLGVGVLFNVFEETAIGFVGTGLKIGSWGWWLLETMELCDKSWEI